MSNIAPSGGRRDQTLNEFLWECYIASKSEAGCARLDAAIQRAREVVNSQDLSPPREGKLQEQHEYRMFRASAQAALCAVARGGNAFGILVPVADVRVTASSVRIRVRKFVAILRLHARNRAHPKFAPVKKSPSSQNCGTTACFLLGQGNTAKSQQYFLDLEDKFMGMLDRYDSEERQTMRHYLYRDVAGHLGITGDGNRLVLPRCAYHFISTMCGPQETGFSGDPHVDYSPTRVRDLNPLNAANELLDGL